MSALTKDRNTVMKEGLYAVYPVKGGVVIYAGGMVCIGTDGYAVPAADTAGLTFVGVSRGHVHNTNGASGAVMVEVWRKGCFEFSTAGMTLANVGAAIYAEDDQTVALSAGSTNHVACGTVSEVNSATSVFVDIQL
ncbi:MAG: hypothetical protein ABSG42_00015 [Nitrospirota bacterium]